MVELGLDLPPDLLALACASHSGEPMHVDGVRRILERRRAGRVGAADAAGPARSTTPSATPGCEPGPGEEPIAHELLGQARRDAARPAWSTAGTSRRTATPDHPLQLALAETFAELTGEPVVVTAVDGCGAPLLSTSLIGLARGFAALATATDGPRAPGRRGDPRAPRDGVRHPPRRAARCSPRSPARSARPAPSPATPSRCPTAGRSRSRPTTVAQRARPVVMAAALRAPASTSSLASTPRRSARRVHGCSVAASRRRGPRGVLMVRSLERSAARPCGSLAAAVGGRAGRVRCLVLRQEHGGPVLAR